MSQERKLVLEILNGPLDGAVITLTAAAEWTTAGAGPLAFPWDGELGKPQARLVPDESGWSLEGVRSPHGTYRVNREERITKGTLQLAGGDILRGSNTWLLVRQVE